MSAWLAASMLLLVSSPAPADSSEVIVHIRPDDGDAGAALAELVRGHEASEPPALRMVVPSAGSRLAAARGDCAATVPPIAVFWLDVARSDEWRLYALPCAAPQPFVREIPFGPGEEQAAIETLQLIVLSSVVAMAAGAEPTMDAVDPATIEPAPVVPPAVVRAPSHTASLPPPPTTPPPRKRFRIGVAYAGETLASAVPWQSGVIATFSFAPRSWLRVGTSYEFLAPAQQEPPAGFALWRHGVALTLAGVIALAKRVDLELRLGGEAELSRWRSDDAGRGELRVIPRLGFDALVQIELGRGVALDLGPGLAVALVDIDFVTCAQGAASCAGADRRVVVDTWRVRPRARAGISVQF